MVPLSSLFIQSPCQWTVGGPEFVARRGCRAELTQRRHCEEREGLQKGQMSCSLGPCSPYSPSAAPHQRAAGECGTCDTRCLVSGTDLSPLRFSSKK